MHRFGFVSVRLLRSDKSYYWRFYWSWYRVAFQSEEIRAALFFPRFKCTTLSLCKSPNLEKAATDYYTVAASPRWDSYGATIDIVEKAVAASKLRSEENRAALLLPQSKYKPLSLCKSPNVHRTGCNYYTVTATPRWDWLRRTASLGFLRSDKGQFSTKRF